MRASTSRPVSKSPDPIPQKDRAATLRVRAGREAREFRAGLSRSMWHVTLLVNISQSLFTVRFIRMNLDFRRSESFE